MSKIVDVIIPTYKPGKEFEELLKRLSRQAYPIHEVHILDTVVGEFPVDVSKYDLQIKVTSIDPKAFDHGGTRDLGARESKAEILLFMTQDALPADQYMVNQLVRQFDGANVAAAYARQLPAFDCHLLERYTRSFNYPKESCIKSKADLPKKGIKTFFCSNVCAAYRKDIYDTMGGFEKKTIFNEDMIYAARLIQEGYQIAYAADAKVIHSHNYHCIQQFHRNFDMAVSQADHPEIFEAVSSENEGIRLVKQTAQYLIHIHKLWLILSLVAQSGCKYLGYKCGKNYKMLPKKLIMKFTMNPRYWGESVK